MKPVRTESGKNRITEILDVLVNECGGEATPGEWAAACEATLGIGRTGFDGRKEKAEKAKLIVTRGNTKKTVCRLSEGIRKDSEMGEYRHLINGVSLKTAQGESDRK